MSVIGGEIIELGSLRQSFLRHSSAVQELMSALRGELDNVYWKGGAAERFRAAWQSEYEPALRNLSAALIEAGDEVGRRADALQQAGG
jgi:WXG100 family type VII secretion target